MTESSADLPYYPPSTRACPFHVPEIAAAAREDAGLKRVRIWSGAEVWLVTRFDDVRTVLSDPRFSADWRVSGFPHHSPASESMMGGLFLRTDGEYHMKVRRLLLREFTVKYAEALRPRLEAVIHEQIDSMLERGPPAELVEELALVLPTRAICLILGVPYEDREIFQNTVNVIVRYGADPQDQRNALAALDDYMRQLTAAKASAPEIDDLMSRLMHGPVANGELSAEEAARACSVLVLAGHETTANQIALSILSFLVEPEARPALLAENGMRPAVEELLRFWSINQFAPRRVALEDVELGGVVVRAGEGLIMSLPAANRDPRQFGEQDLEALDVTREGRQQIAFGFGPHQCLGQNLARMEMRIVLKILFERMPTLRLAKPVEELRFNTDQHIYGLRSLPVTW